MSSIGQVLVQVPYTTIHQKNMVPVLGFDDLRCCGGGPACRTVLPATHKDFRVIAFSLTSDFSKGDPIVEHRVVVVAKCFKSNCPFKEDKEPGIEIAAFRWAGCPLQPNVMNWRFNKLFDSYMSHQKMPEGYEWPAKHHFVRVADTNNLTMADVLKLHEQPECQAMPAPVPVAVAIAAPSLVPKSTVNAAPPMVRQEPVKEYVPSQPALRPATVTRNKVPEDVITSISAEIADICGKRNDSDFKDAVSKSLRGCWAEEIKYPAQSLSAFEANMRSNAIAILRDALAEIGRYKELVAAILETKLKPYSNL